MMYSIGIWDDEVTRIWSGVVTQSDLTDLAINRTGPPDNVLKELLDESLDIALLPPDIVLSHIRQLDILPAVALSTASNPFAVISLDSLGDTTPLMHADRGKRMYYEFISEIILKEHYGRIIVEKSRMGTDSEMQEFSVLHASPEHGFTLDLAREWTELVNYPLICGLFVTRRKNASADMISTVRDVTLQVETRKGTWLSKQKFTPDQKQFYSTVIGFRFDELAVASLSELCEYLYYYGVTSEIPTFTLASIADVDRD